MSKSLAVQFEIMKRNAAKKATPAEGPAPMEAMDDEGAPTSVVEAIMEKRRAAKMMAEGYAQDPNEGDELGKENYSEAEESLTPSPAAPTDRSSQLRARIKALRK